MTRQFFRALGAGLVATATIGLPGLAMAAVAGHPVEGQIGLQGSVTPIMDEIEAFHNGMLIWIISFIVLLVLALLVYVMIRFNAKAHPVPSTTTHNALIEILWTVMPILTLIVIAIPSFGTLTDQLTIPDGHRKYLGSSIFSFGTVEVPAPGLTVKVTGNQWYWTYDYPDEDNLHFDSNVLQDADLKPGDIRLLSVDNPLVVPVNTTVRVQITASDVIHSWAVPSFGVKMDAIPGRLNETWFNARKPGRYYGQCSQLCGKDHAFMPIEVEVVTMDQYKTWMAKLKSDGVEAANATLTNT